MAIIARGELALDADTSGLQSQLQGAIGGAVAGLGAKLAAAFAGVKIGGIFKNAIQDSIDFTEAASRVQVVFGSAANEVLKLGSNSAAAFGQSRKEAISAAGDIGNLLTSFGLTQEKAAGMSVQLVKLAGDLTALNNVPVEESLTALRAALVGEVEPIRRLGVSFNEAELKARAAKLGLGSFGNAVSKTGANALAVAKAVERLSDVQRESAERLGDLQEQAAKKAADAVEKIATAVDRAASAEEKFGDVQRASAGIQRRLTDARREAQRTLEDLTFAVGDNALAQRQANLNIKKAVEDQKRTNKDVEASELDKQQAIIDVARARRDALEVSRDNRHEEEELADANRKGVNGADAVVSAQEAVLQQQRDLRDADKERVESIKDVTKAQEDAAKVQADSAKDIARAQEDAARNISRAQRDIAEASKSAGAAISEFGDQLPPAVRALSVFDRIMEVTAKNVQGNFLLTSQDPAQVIRTLTKNVQDLSTGLGIGLKPALMAGLDLINRFLPTLQQMEPHFATFGIAVLELGKSFGAGLGGIAPIITGLISSIGPALGQLAGPIAQVAGLFTGLVGQILGALGPSFVVLLGSITDVAQKIADAMVPIFEEMRPLITEFGDAFLKITEALIPLIPMFGELIIAALPLLPLAVQLAVVFAEMLASIPPGVLQALVGSLILLTSEFAAAVAIAAVLTTVLPPEAILAIAAAFLILTSEIAAAIVLVAAIGLAFKALIPVFKGVFNFVKTNWPLLLAILTGPFGLAALAINKNFDKIKGAATTFVNVLTSVFSGMWTAIQAVFQGAITLIQGVVRNWFRIMVGIATLGGSEVLGFIVRNWEQIKETVTGGIAAVVGFFQTLPARLGAAVQAASTAVIGFIQDMVERIVGFVQDLPGKLADIGSRMIQGFLDATRSAVTGVYDFLRDTVTSIVGFFLDMPEKFARIGGDIIGGLIDGIKGVPGALFNAIKEIVGDILRQFKELFGIHSPSQVFEDMGADLIRGLWEGIKGLGSWLWDRITEFAKKYIPGPIRKVLGLESPSKLFKGYGRDIVQGLAIGINDESYLAARATAEMARKVNAAFSASPVRVAATFGGSAGGGPAGPGGSGGTTTIGSGNTFTIIDNTGDPEATAQSVAARMGMAARR